MCDFLRSFGDNNLSRLIFRVKAINGTIYILKSFSFTYRDFCYSKNFIFCSILICMTNAIDVYHNRCSKTGIQEQNLASKPEHG